MPFLLAPNPLRVRRPERTVPRVQKTVLGEPSELQTVELREHPEVENPEASKGPAEEAKVGNGKRHLADLRVVQKNLVFVVGISPRIADPDVLKKNEFFGKFGKIHKVVVNPCLQGTTASAYITYIKSDDALRAIQSVNNIPFDGKTIKVSLGTTKYCSHFMRNQTCPKTECMYLHHYGDPDASFTKEDMQAGKHQEYEKKLLEEFNTHAQQNNNNNEQVSGFSQVTKVSASTNGMIKKISSSASIQQGVSYSTKLLVNSTPKEPEVVDKKLEEEPKVVEEKDETKISELLQNTNLSSSSSCVHSSEEDEDEEEVEEQVKRSETPAQEEQSGVVENIDDLDSLIQSNNLDLDFDPFHETQKAFEQIINEQVARVDSSASESSSLLRRFIQPNQDQDLIQSPGFNDMMGFQQQQQQHLNQYNNQSNILDFFNSFAYKQQQPTIPPPPGFSSQQPDIMKRNNVVVPHHLTQHVAPPPPPHHNPVHWIDESAVSSADWMSLDPAIIFSKTSSNDNRVKHHQVFVEQQQSALHGLFGSQQQHALYNGQNGGENRVYGGQLYCQQQNNHALLRPTPTTSASAVHPSSASSSSSTPPQNYPYTNMQQQNYYTPTPPQQAARTANASYFPSSTQQQPRFYAANTQQPQQNAVVTPPPPGFGGLVNNNFSSKQFQQFHVQQQMHNGGVPASSSFFPF